MANSLGGLIVTLGLDAAEFVTGLTASEQQAQKFARSVDQGIATAVNLGTIALAGMTAAALATFAAVDQLTKQAANFQDLAEKTGANAETLASFAIAAATAGTSMETVAAASVKLTKNLTGVDDESKDAGAALTALGINIKEFKSLDPATQMETIAKALNTFADGGGKTAAAVALLGKSGADALPFLKELGNEGGRQIILNREQIRLADEYSDKQARTRAEINAMAQALAIGAIPAIQGATAAAKDFIKELFNIDTAGKSLAQNNPVREFSEKAALYLADVVDVGDAVVRVFRAVGESYAAGFAFEKALLTGDVKRAKEVWTEYGRELDKIAMKEQYSAKVARQFAEQHKNDALRSVEDRGFDPRAGVPFKGGGKVGGAGALKEKTSEAERYLQSLEKQLQGTLELSVAEQAEVEIWNLMRDAQSGLTAERAAIIRDYAEQITASQELKKTLEEQRRAEEEALRFRQRAAQENARAVEHANREAQSVRDGTTAIEDQIVFLRGGEEALKKLTDARLADSIASKEQEVATLLFVGASDELVKAVADQVAALRDRQAAMGKLDLAKQFAAEQKAIQDLANSLTDSFASAFEGFIDGTKSAKDAFKSFTDDVTRMITRLALQKIGDAIFGGKTAGGPDFFTLIGKFIGMWAGASGGGGVSATSGGAGIELGSLAAGTDNWRGGLTLVHKDEVINLPRGAQVIPKNEARRGGGDSIVIPITVNAPPGMDTRSARQIGLTIGDQVRGVMTRR